MTERGIITLPSSHSVAETMDRLEAAVTAKAITVFARIDHAKGAAQAAMPLRPTELLVFGSAKAGTPLMLMDQATGIDLPLKMLSWEDEDGRVWLAYNDPAWIARRHGLGSDADPAVNMLLRTLAELARIASE